MRLWQYSSLRWWFLSVLSLASLFTACAARATYVPAESLGLVNAGEISMEWWNGEPDPEGTCGEAQCPFGQLNTSDYLTGSFYGWTTQIVDAASTAWCYDGLPGSSRQRLPGGGGSFGPGTFNQGILGTVSSTNVIVTCAVFHSADLAVFDAYMASGVGAPGDYALASFALNWDGNFLYIQSPYEGQQFTENGNVVFNISWSGLPASCNNIDFSVDEMTDVNGWWVTGIHEDFPIITATGSMRITQGTFHNGTYMVTLKAEQNFGQDDILCGVDSVTSTFFVSWESGLVPSATSEAAAANERDWYVQIGGNVAEYLFTPRNYSDNWKALHEAVDGHFPWNYVAETYDILSGTSVTVTASSYPAITFDMPAFLEAYGFTDWTIFDMADVRNFAGDTFWGYWIFWQDVAIWLGAFWFCVKESFKIL